MRSIVVRSLSLVLLLSACGGSGVPSSPPSQAPGPEADDEPSVPEARLSVERHSGYGPDWDDAYEAILAVRLQAFARLGVTRVVLSPHAVDGKTFRHIVRVHLHFDDGDSKSIVVVADGQVLDRSAGAEGLTAYLSGLGFPRRLQPAPLLNQLVCYFEDALADRDPWCSAIGEEPAAEARVVRTRDGAALVLERELAPSPDEPAAETGGAPPGEVPHRLAIRFDEEAQVTVRAFRKRPNGSWRRLKPPE